ncbi:hypothetical protein JCM8097_000625 [Rhodosporidiobolus ruineniae]
MGATGPALPPRPAADPDPIPDEPPPAYEPTPTAHNEQTLDYGPTRPFQPPSHPPPQASSSYSYSPPPHPPHSPPTLPPPGVPFWNGPNLTPAQTGFSEGPVRPLDQHAPYSPYPSSSSSSPYAAPPGPPPHHPSTSPHSGYSSPAGPPPHNAPPHTDNRAGKYAPTERPEPGHPLLNGGKLLVFPAGSKVCSKCSNTGYKPFDPYTGYRGDDPSHPCRKCWAKHGRPFSGPLALSCRDLPASEVPANYQRPLRLLQTPQTAPRPPQVTVTHGSGYGHMPLNPNAIVVRPGDPRMGGVLCRRCGGDGLVPGFLLIDEVTCEVCRGAGRVFL